MRYLNFSLKVNGLGLGFKLSFFLSSLIEKVWPIYAFCLYIIPSHFLLSIHFAIISKLKENIQERVKERENSGLTSISATESSRKQVEALLSVRSFVGWSWCG